MNIDPEILLALNDPRAYLAHVIRRQSKPGSRSNVRHHETCPKCGRTLVNLYYLDGEWKCRRCWNGEGGAN